MIRVMLASRSPRRRKILEQLGLVFESVSPEVQELEGPGDPVAMVCENARRKWQWCYDRFPEVAIIAADTTVELDGHCLGKPSSREEAFTMLRMASGRMQTVYTGYMLALPGETAPSVRFEVSSVFFRELTNHEIDAYVEAVQPFDRAGAYDIDCHGDRIIQRYEGSRTNVMGLPAERVKEWMECKLAL